MQARQRILLLEGQDDRDFFQEFLCKLNLSVKVEPETPRNFCGTVSDGVDVIRTQALPVAWNLIKKGNIRYLGIIVDADASVSGNGFFKRREQFTEKLREYGYEIPLYSTSNVKGEIFSHPEEYAPIGLWIMPTHSKDGMLEDLILSNLANSIQKKLLKKTDKALNKLVGELRLFKKSHLSKTRLATLLAWQRNAGIAMNKAHTVPIFDDQSKNFIHLSTWLQQLFPNE